MTFSNVLSEASEVLFAAIVRAIILALRQIIPGLDELWKDWKWKNLTTFGLSFLVVPMTCWMLECIANPPVDIPGFVVRCTFEGVILDALYPGFLAYTLNFSGEKAFRWLEDNVRAHPVLSPIYAFLTWLGSLPFYLFLATVLIEFMVLVAGLSPIAGAVVSIVVTLITTIVAILLPALIRGLHNRATMAAANLLWLIFMIAKIVLHFLPISPFLKPVISITMTVVLYVIVNVVAGNQIYGAYKEKLW